MNNTSYHPYNQLYPLPVGACPSCGQDHQTQGKLCVSCQELKDSWALTKTMKARRKK